jgi:ABC-2 type transport system permease protein
VQATAETTRLETPVASRPGFTATLASEWLKVASLRSTWISLGVAGVLALALAALLANIVGATWDEWSPGDRATFEPVGTALVGQLVLMVVLPVLGVKAATSEYGSGMIRTTLIATPRRTRVLLAKAGIVAGVSAAVTLVAAIGMLLVSGAVLGAYDLDGADVLARDTLLALAGAAAMAPLFPLLGLALGFTLRSTAGAVTSVLGLIFVPGIVLELVPERWQDRVAGYLPGPASNSVALAHLDPTYHHLDVVPSLLVVCAWIAGALALAALALERRDA